jgi:xanthine phosphoribosyltransferase
MEKTIVSWRGIMSLCTKIVEQLKDKQPNILDFEIVGLSRGGLIPSVIISNMLNIRKVYSVGLRTYADQEKASNAELYQVPDISSMQKILLIDDISDSGDSFISIKKMLVNKEVITASLFLKKRTKFIPDVYAKKAKDESWIVFPWE